MKNKPKVQKQITSKEQKQLQVLMLEFVDKICRKNNIKYSAIGGTLIGAIRHKGFIPWDDDIDIILTKNNYDKLKRILDKETGRYRTLKYGQGGECFSFTKLIDTNTHLMEKRQLNYNPNYGVYIDIFCYYPAPNDKEAQKEMYSKLRFLNKIMARGKIKYDTTFINKVKRLSKNILSRLYGYNRINKLTKEYANKYVGKNTDYVMSDWLVYSLNQEIQLRKNTEGYIDAKFENLSIMVFKNYNEILRTTFGDYMKLPPKSERIPKHDLIAWWKEGNE